MIAIKSIVSAALAKDSDESHLEAYAKYLEGLYHIVKSLQADFSEEALSNESVKLIRLGQQCLERMGKLVERIHNLNPQFLPKDTIQCNEHKDPANVADTMNKDIDASPATNEKISNFPIASSSLTPLEAAQKQNKMLLTAYRKRMETVNMNKYEATNLSLALQRKMAENMAVAKAKEDTLLRKQRERHRRLLEESERMLRSGFGTSKSEQEKRQFYKEVLEYEKKSKSLLIWRDRLKSNPSDIGEIKRLLEYILSLEDHPLTKLLSKYQYNTCDKLYPILDSCNDKLLQVERNLVFKEEHRENKGQSNKNVPRQDPLNGIILKCTEKVKSLNVLLQNYVEKQNNNNSEDEQSTSSSNREALQRHVKNIVGDVHMYMDKIKNMFLVIYTNLNNNQGKDLIYSCIEEKFFHPLWHFLIALYRIANKNDEDEFTSALIERNCSSPSEFNVRRQFQLWEPVPTSESFPYEQAVEQLNNVFLCTSPLPKLECIVNTSNQIIQCIENHYNLLENEEVPSVGADDLLPIFMYVISRTNKKELLAEIYSLEDFIHEGYMMGKEGYCLITVKTAVACLHKIKNVCDSPDAET